MLSSLRAKITFGFALVGALFLGMGALALFELRLVQDKIRAGAAIAEFLEVSLEIRRFEKNFFLYRQPQDLVEQQSYLARAGELLGEHAAAFEALDDLGAPGNPGEAGDSGAATRIARLQDDLARYRRHMGEYVALAEQVGQGARRRELEPLIRQDGKRIVDFAEAAARRERALLQASLAQHQLNLLLSLGVVVLLIVPVGHFVASRLRRPLKDLERHMEGVARGNREPLHLASEDREMQSLNRAFNHMLDELELRQKHLVRSEKLASLGTLLSGVAHELNNPLSNISTNVQILIEDADTLAPREQRGMIVEIDQQTERARRIVRALLDFARDQPIRTEPVALRELVVQTLDFLKGVVPSAVAVRVLIPEALEVGCDRQRLQQVLLNLVKNAVEAGSREVRIEARRCALVAGPAPSADGEPAEGVEIEVADDGPGIAPDILSRVFDPFFTTKDVGQGCGLGLFVANEIIEEHRGTLTVGSRPGAGTRFRILLPQNAPAEVVR